MPSLGGSAVGAPSLTPKGFSVFSGRFISWTGHIPRLQVQSQVGAVREGSNFHSLSLKKNERKRKKEGRKEGRKEGINK